MRSKYVKYLLFYLYKFYCKNIVFCMANKGTCLEISSKLIKLFQYSKFNI